MEEKDTVVELLLLPFKLKQTKVRTNEEPHTLEKEKETIRLGLIDSAIEIVLPPAK